VLYTPTSNFRSKKGLFGVVTTSGRGGQIMRRASIPVNPNSPAQSRARHIFLCVKQNWKAMQPGGINVVPIDGFDPATLWVTQASQYLGIYVPGFQVDGVEEMGYFASTQTGEAYFTMCQINRANLGLTPLPPPPYSPITLQSAGTSVSGTAGPYTIGASILNTTPNYSWLAQLTLTISAATNPIPAPPATTATGDYTWTLYGNQIAMPLNSTLVRELVLAETTPYLGLIPAHAVSITGMPAGVTAAFAPILPPYWYSIDPPPSGYWVPANYFMNQTITFSIGPSVTPGTYTIAITSASTTDTTTTYMTLVVYDPAADPYAITIGTLPTGMTVDAPAPTFLNTYVSADDSNPEQTTAIVRMSGTTPPGSYNLPVSFTWAGDTVNLDVPFTVVSGDAQSADPPPYFATPGNASSATVYDGSLNVVDFQLAYFSLGGLSPNPPKRGPVLPTTWLITASDNYTSSYSPPDAGTWLPIGYSTGPGPILYGYSLLAGSPLIGLRALWETTFGPLPPNGNILFQITPIDADTGASGPPLTTTCSWQNGTLRNSNLLLAPVPLWGISTEAVLPAVTAPGTASCTLAISGQPGYTGTIALKIAAGKDNESFDELNPYPLPTGVTFAFSPPTVSLDPTSEGPVSVTLTITAASGAAAFNAQVKISGTDNVSTVSYHSLLVVSGDVVTLPPLLQLGAGVANRNPNLSQGGSVVCPCVVANQGPDTLSVSMLATAANSGLSFTWDVPAFTLAPGTPATPTNITVNLTITAAPLCPTTRTTVFIEAHAGSQVAECGLIPTWV
jgi:hypothetical protein